MPTGREEPPRHGGEEASGGTEAGGPRMTRLTPLTCQAHMTQAARSRRTRMQDRRGEADDGGRDGMDHDEQLLLHRGAHGDAQQGALHPGCRTTSTDSPGKQSACTCAARLSAGSSPEGPSTRSQTRRGTAAPCLPEEPERNRSTCLTNNDIYAPTVRPNRQVSLISTTTVEKRPSEERGLPGFLATLSRYVLRPRPHTDRSGLPPPSPQPPRGDG